MNYHEKIKEKSYDFLRENEHLKDNIILLGLGGSHAYGTNVETSDLDIRGFATNRRKEILLGRDFEQVECRATDTVIFSLKKGLHQLSKCNPNAIEILGLKPEHYLILTKQGKELIDNKDMFLSRKASESFGGNINQLKSAIEKPQKHGVAFNEAIGKIYKQNENLVRLYYMSFDILEKGEVVTYREEEHDLLMDIRKGKYHSRNIPKREFRELIENLEERFKYAKENTSLPEQADEKRIEDFLMSVNERIILSPTEKVKEKVSKAKKSIER